MIDEQLKQLREMPCDPGCEGRCRWCPQSVGQEAAERIERLAMERAELALHLHAMLQLHGKPHREAWISAHAWEHAVIITENATAAFDRVTRPISEIER